MKKTKPKPFEIEMVPISDLLHPENNPRIMPERAREDLDGSLDKFGCVQNIVVNRRNMHIVGGNQRVTALRDKGASHAPVKFVDLDEDDEEELNLALNKISGIWDDAKLAKSLERLKDENRRTGFSKTETESLIQRVKDREKLAETASSAAERPSSSVPSVSPTIEFKFGDFRAQVPREIYENFVAEVARIKASCWPKEDPENVSVIQPLEYILANSANTPLELV